MKLEGIICCVDYSDYLAETLPLNLRHFVNEVDAKPSLVVVTAPEDRETQRICTFYGVRHVQTDVFRTRWQEMHKGKGINKGLEWLDRDEWVLHMDADMVLPPKTRELIGRAGLDKGKLYGCDRFNVPGHEAWRAHQAMPALQQSGYHVALDIFPLAPRFSGSRMGGYAPPGFFQLWHAGTRDLSYPENHTDASRTDVLFTANWYRKSREMLPEFVAYHLMAEPSPQGSNWGGRVTPRWGAEPVLDKHHPRNHRDPPAHAENSHEDGHWRPRPHPKPKPDPRPRPHPHPHPHPHPGPYGPGPEQEQES